MLVALAVGSGLLGVAITMALGSRQMFATDETRTRVQQSLRTSLDLLGIDVRQAGERLPGDFPAIEIVNGVSGAPDTLILRRNLLNEVLPLCETLTVDDVDDEVLVADAGADPAPGCSPVPDGDADGVPDNIDSWLDFRTAAAAAVPVYLFNPTAGVGEWFLFDGPGSSGDLFLEKANDDPWQATYDIDEQGRVYVLEERRYTLNGDLLEFLVNLSTTPIHVAANLTDFQVRAIMADGTTVESLTAADEWTGLAAIEVSIAATNGIDSDAISGELSARFFPRNVLSN